MTWLPKRGDYVTVTSARGRLAEVREDLKVEQGHLISVPIRYLPVRGTELPQDLLDAVPRCELRRISGNTAAEMRAAWRGYHPPEAFDFRAGDYVTDLGEHGRVAQVTGGTDLNPTRVTISYLRVSVSPIGEPGYTYTVDVGRLRPVLTGTVVALGRAWADSQPSVPVQSDLSTSDLVETRAMPDNGEESLSVSPTRLGRNHASIAVRATSVETVSRLWSGKTVPGHEKLVRYAEHVARWIRTGSLDEEETED